MVTIHWDFVLEETPSPSAHKLVTQQKYVPRNGEEVQMGDRIYLVNKVRFFPFGVKSKPSISHAGSAGMEYVEVTLTKATGGQY